MKVNKYKLIAFLFGLGASISIRVVGIFAISDIIAIILFPFLIQKHDLFSDKRFRRVIILLFFWMASAVISDIYNQSAILDALKGFFNLVPFLACLLFAYWLLKRDYELIKPFVWGSIISFTLSAGFGLDAFYIESIARAGVSNVSQLKHYNKIIIWIVSGFITGAFSVTYFYRFPRIVTSVLFLLSFVQLLEGSRGNFLITFLASSLLIYILIKTNKLPWDGVIWKQNLKINLLRLSVYSFILIFAAKSIYSVGVMKGYLGYEESRKYEMQNNTKIGLLAGRGEIISSLLAIRDSPILGHGSYAKDKNGYGFIASTLVGYDNNNLEISLNEIGENYIPTHSHLWAAWVYNGILGGVFWFYVLIGILVPFMIKYLFYFPKYLAYILFASLTTFWNILFSPMSQKPGLSMVIILLIVLMSKIDNLENKTNKEQQ